MEDVNILPIGLFSTNVQKTQHIVSFKCYGK